MKLNGWQRLWVVVSVLWLLITVMLAYSLWPQPDRVADFAVTTPDGLNHVLTEVSALGDVKHAYQMYVNGKTVQVAGLDRLPTSSELDQILATVAAPGAAEVGTERFNNMQRASNDEINSVGARVAQAAPLGLSKDQFDALVLLAVDASHSALARRALIATIRTKFPSAYNDLSDDKLQEMALAKYSFLKIGGDVTLNIPNIGRVNFPDSMSGDAINGAVRRLVRQKIRQQRLTLLGQTLAGWAVPLFALYAFGWAIGWVRHGFGSGS